jgi:uncharacterized protein
MSAQGNKELVTRFFQAVRDRDADALEQCVAADATWWFPLRWSSDRAEPADGRGQLWPRSAFFELMDDLTGRFTAGPVVTPISITADDQRVCFEAEGHGVVGGEDYDNRYHFVFELHDGRISGIREYMNTAHVARVIFPDRAVWP